MNLTLAAPTGAETLVMHPLPSGWTPLPALRWSDVDFGKRVVHARRSSPAARSALRSRSASGSSLLGPFFIHRLVDDVVVGEIGGGFVGRSVAEIGYAIVASCHGRGQATDAVRLVVDVARTVGTSERLIAHTPLDRPASGRVVAKAGSAP